MRLNNPQVRFQSRHTEDFDQALKLQSEGQQCLQHSIAMNSTRYTFHEDEMGPIRLQLLGQSVTTAFHLMQK
jgi:hypothetical protein